jgi:flagellar FliL protein
MKGYFESEPKNESRSESRSAFGGGSKKLIIIILALVLVLGAAAAVRPGSSCTARPMPKNMTTRRPRRKSQEAGRPAGIRAGGTVHRQPAAGRRRRRPVPANRLHAGSSGLEEKENVKNNMAKVRSRMLLLLSSKRAADINTPEGKVQLAKEIIAQLREPFEDRGAPQEIEDVLFTSFIIQ